MSTEGDEVVFYNSVTNREEEFNNVLFKDRNFTYIVDQTSSAGTFASGQCQFDLQSLASQSQWVNLQEAIITFPVRISADSATASFTPSLNTFTIKNGFHQFIDSCQLIIDGQTIKSAQAYQNVVTQFKILSQWSQDELVKYGPSLGISLDDCTGTSPTTGLNNLDSPDNTFSATNPISSVGGFAAYTTGLGNKALAARTSMLTNLTAADSATAGPVSQKTMGSSSIKNQGNHNAAFQSGTGANRYLAFYLATVRLRDLVDLESFPMVKNLKGYLYLNFNSTQIVATCGTNTVTNLSITPLSGRTCPILMNPSFTSTTGSVVTARVEVNGASDKSLGTAGPVMSTARLNVPMYESNPKADGALTMTGKKFSSMENLVNPIYIGKGASTNVTLTSGVANPRGLILLPMWTDIGASSFTNPELNPFDSVPATSGVFATLSNLQVFKANKAMYLNPVQYTYDQWLQENSKTGAAGGQADTMASGLLSEQLFNQNMRFYYTDLSRRLESEDGQSQSIQVSFTNASSLCSMKVICIVLYEKFWTIDTSLCKISSA